jgi:SAM-dependent methyltransferase
MLQIEKYIKNLSLQDGIWRTAESGEVSYPAGANDFCYEIEDKSFWFKNRNKIIYEVIKNYSLTSLIFDIGGGNGFVSDYLSKLNYETVLVEPGLDGCINGKKRGLKHIINSKIDDTHFNSGNIPNIGIFDVLEHIDDQKEFLAILLRNLKPDGRLFITVPAFKFLWSAEDNYAGHFRRYRIKELHKLLKDIGFELLYSTYFYSILLIPIFVLRTIPSKLGLYKIKTQHSKDQYLSNSDNLLNNLINFEINRIKKGKSILFGSSLLLVAKKR